MRRFFPWPGLIFVFIGTTVLVQGATLFYALGDDSHAVVPNYDTKADAWDEHAAERRASADLGWQLEAVASPVQGGATTLQLQLEGAEGPVQGSFVAYHNATPQQRHAGSVQADASGRFELLILDDRPGWYQLELELRHGQDRFLHAEKLWLPLHTSPLSPEGEGLGVKVSTAPEEANP